MAPGSTRPIFGRTSVPFEKRCGIAGMAADISCTAAARALGVDSTPNPQWQVVGLVRSHEQVLGLDNCEHIVAAAGEFTATGLKSGAGVRVLAASRDPLRVQDEWVHRLAPLDSPDREVSVTAQDAIRYSAVELLVERIAAVVRA